MVLFISQNLAKHIQEKYSIDLTKDKELSLKDYDPNLCLARVWKSDKKYKPNAGGYSNFQCSYRPKDGKNFCECHQNKLLSFGRIDEEKPPAPIITDLLGNQTRYYWIEDSEDMKNEFYSEKEKNMESGEKRGRGRPPTKRQDYDSIDWEDVCKTNKLNDFTLDVLKKFLKEKKLDHYGRKENIIKRIKEYFNCDNSNVQSNENNILIDNVSYRIDDSNNIIDMSGKTLGLYIRQINQIQYQDNDCKLIHERNVINAN